MKLFICVVTFLTSLTLAASTADYDILRGQHHKGGSLKITGTVNGDQFKVKVKYKLKKKGYVPIPSSRLKGESETILPFEFSTEDGYLNLEKEGTVYTDDAKIVFIGRIDIDRFKDSYRIKIYPKNNKSTIEAIYHPQVKGIGWYRIKVELKKVLNGYIVKALVK